MPRDRRRQSRELTAFLFDVEKYLASTPCRRMLFRDQGVYLVMLFHEWRKGALPDDVEAVVDLMAVNDAQAAEIREAWPIVRRRFVTNEQDATWIQNVTLEETRRKQRRQVKVLSDRGRSGGEAAARNRRERAALEAALKSGVSTAEVDSSVALGREGNGRERNGKEDPERDSAATPSVAPPLPLSPVVLTFPTIGLQREWLLTEAKIAEWGSLYPGLDVLGESRHALAWVQANGKKTAKGMPAFLVSWFNRAVKAGANRRGPPSGGDAVQVERVRALLGKTG